MACRLLGVTDGKTALDAAVSNVVNTDIQQAEVKSTALNAETSDDDKSSTIDKLRRRVSQLQTQLDHVTRDLQQRLDERDRQIDRLRPTAHRLPD